MVSARKRKQRWVDDINGIREDKGIRNVIDLERDLDAVHALFRERTIRSVANFSADRLSLAVEPYYPVIRRLWLWQASACILTTTPRRL